MRVIGIVKPLPEQSPEYWRVQSHNDSGQKPTLPSKRFQLLDEILRNLSERLLWLRMNCSGGFCRIRRYRSQDDLLRAAGVVHYSAASPIAGCQLPKLFRATRETNCGFPVSPSFMLNGGKLGAAVLLGKSRAQRVFLSRQTTYNLTLNELIDALSHTNIHFRAMSSRTTALLSAPSGSSLLALLVCGYTRQYNDVGTTALDRN